MDLSIVILLSVQMFVIENGEQSPLQPHIDLK